MFYLFAAVRWRKKSQVVKRKQFGSLRGRQGHRWHLLDTCKTGNMWRLSLTIFLAEMSRKRK